MTKKTSKAYELINELRYNSKFQKEVNSLRETNSIPLSGFSDVKAFNQWQEKLKFAEDFYDSITQLSIDYKVPSNMFEYLETYFFYGDKLDDFKYRENVCELDQESQIGTIFTKADANWADGRTPFVKVFISDNASLNDTQYFLEKNWKNIQKKLSEQHNGPKQRLRRKVNLKRDARIRELYKLSHAQLEISKGKMAKEVRIAEIIFEELKEKVDIINVRKIGSYNPKT